MSAIPVPLVAATASRLLPQRLGRWSLGDAATVTPARGAFSTARSRIADAGLIEPVVTPAHWTQPCSTRVEPRLRPSQFTAAQPAKSCG
jgi:hypothetical protein